MRLCTMPACALAVAAATVVSALAFTPAASADGSEITIVSVSSPTPPSGNAGQLTVTTESGSQITYLDVLLYDPQGHLELTIPFSDFTETGAGTGSQSNEEFWSVQNPITTTASGGLPGLAPGTYTATADATDADGAETGLTGARSPS
ncbi:MAG: hypothetical protein ACRDRJ_45925 [Streptosporangiaceae bacterium]